MKIHILVAMPLFSLVGRYQRFGGTCCRHLQDLTGLSDYIYSVIVYKIPVRREICNGRIITGINEPYGL
jgi:hypothetical protein